MIFFSHWLSNKCSVSFRFIFTVMPFESSFCCTLKSCFYAFIFNPSPKWHFLNVKPGLCLSLLTYSAHFLFITNVPSSIFCKIIMNHAISWINIACINRPNTPPLMKVVFVCSVINHNETQYSYMCRHTVFSLGKPWFVFATDSIFRVSCDIVVIIKVKM